MHYGSVVTEITPVPYAPPAVAARQALAAVLGGGSSDPLPSAVFGR